MNPSARITRVHTSWRVRVPGHPPRFFADGSYGGKEASFAAARAWRDERWDGQHRYARKLSAEQCAAIRRSRKPAAELAEQYGVTRQHIYRIRRKL